MINQIHAQHVSTDKHLSLGVKVEKPVAKHHHDGMSDNGSAEDAASCCDFTCQTLAIIHEDDVRSEEARERIANGHLPVSLIWTSDFTTPPPKYCVESPKRD